MALKCDGTQCFDDVTTDDIMIIGTDFPSYGATSEAAASASVSSGATPVGVDIDSPLTTWAGLITVLILVFTALGNTLVCIAITWDKRLQNMTNYFLMSLAVTDFMVALLVMPFGILVVVKGTFPLSPVYCVVYITLDVLFCTCSILHLCTLSVDRYLSLRYPIKYGRNKTKRRVVLKICLVWMTSVAMSVPLSLMYSRGDKAAVIKDGVCAIQDPLYMTIGSIISFYIPLLIMLVTHALTMRLLKEAEISKSFSVVSRDCGSIRLSGATVCGSKGAERKTSGGTGAAGADIAVDSATESPKYSSVILRQPHCPKWKRLLYKTYSNVSASTEVDTSETPSTMELQSLTTTPDDTPTSQQQQQQRRRSQRPNETPIHQSPLQLSSNDKEDEEEEAEEDSSSEEVWVEVAIDPSGRTDSLTLTPIAVGQPDNYALSRRLPQNGKYVALCCGGGGDDGGTGLESKTMRSPPLPPPTVPHNGRPSNDIHPTSIKIPTTVVSPARASLDSAEDVPTAQQPLPTSSVLMTSSSAVHQQQRATSIRRSTTKQGRYIQSERKATKVLGIIFFTFVILWTPFFCLNIVAGLCPTCGQNISPTVSYVVLWLGYASSTVNPLFYTIFNPTFRQTFARILTLQFK